MTKEELLQDWLPRLWGALIHVRAGSPADAEEDLYELYVEMRQQTLSEKLETFSEITLEDQLSAMAIELLAAQKRAAELENGICQRAFEAKQEQGEPVAYGMRDTMIGNGNRMMYVRLDKGQDGCTVPLYTTPQQRTWVGLTDEEVEMIVENRRAAHWEFIRQVEAKLKEKNT